MSKLFMSDLTKIFPEICPMCDMRSQLKIMLDTVEGFPENLGDHYGEIVTNLYNEIDTAISLFSCDCETETVEIPLMLLQQLIDGVSSYKMTVGDYETIPYDEHPDTDALHYMLNEAKHAAQLAGKYVPLRAKPLSHRLMETSLHMEVERHLYLRDK